MSEPEYVMIDDIRLGGRIDRGICDPGAASALLGALAGESAADSPPARAVAAILDPGGETVSGALIAKLRGLVHERINHCNVQEEDLAILTLCRRHEDLVAQAMRMEAVIHALTKEARQ